MSVDSLELNNKPEFGGSHSHLVGNINQHFLNTVLYSVIREGNTLQLLSRA